MEAPLRRLTPYLLAGVLVFLSAMSISRVVQLRRDLGGQMEKQLTDDLRDRVDAWEENLLEQLTEWTDLIAANPTRTAEVQQRLRQLRPWFDSAYVWIPSEELSVAGRPPVTSNGYFIFPESRPLREHPDVINRIPCLSRARVFSSQAIVDPRQAAAAWRSWCQDRDASVRTLALTEAVNGLLRVGLFEDAAAAIEADGFPQSLALADAPKLGIPAHRAMVLQTQRAEVLESMGRADEAYALLFRVGMEVTSLDGPEAKLLLPWVSFPIIDRLQRRGDTIAALTLEKARRRAQRRVDGFDDVSLNLVNRVGPVDAKPRFIVDPYGREPYLLFVNWPSNSNVGVAVQLDEGALLEALLDELKRYRKQITITNSSSKLRVAGAPLDTAIQVDVPFSRTLTHLRVSLHDTAIQARLTRLNGIWIVPALLLAIVVFMGVLALVEQYRAGNKQRLLLQRQQEFATRVTHELKTPLAGIKVMAESLEMGAFKDDDERESMARSIVREADHLTHRVNEILAVTRERVVREPQPFDPEEPLYEAIDAWGPRLEQAGVVFEAELEPTDEVLGDAEALRDAVACLLDNALKYRRPDADPPTVSLTCVQVGQRVQIAVTDNGIGVPEAMRTQIFDRFVRVEGENRGAAGGHGLGLAQVAQIAAAHRGTARCEPVDGGGSRFVLDLPAL